VWINNPTDEEIDLALAQGAVGCTTNPAYCGGLLKRSPELIRPLVATIARVEPDDREVADEIQIALVTRIASRFAAVHEATQGKLGYVSIQGSPEADTNPAVIIAEARTGRAIGPNVAPKLPATAAGLAAFEVLVAEGCPTIVTEVFSVSQLIDTCERYLKVTAAGSRPPFFMSPITGIFGDHIKALAKQSGRALRVADADLVGVALSRECYRIVEERSYPVTLLCGGARTSFDLTGLVGAPVHCTINGTTFAEVLASDVPFEPGFSARIDSDAIQRLGWDYPDVRRAFDPTALTVDQFESFGPVQHFRNNFLAGWQAVLDAIHEERLHPQG
jgi:transaldolase